MRFGKVFWEFLWLGCISFGGPAAHVGYFHRRFVVRLGWLDEATYARLLALTQFLPGPASSQLGFAIGRHRGGLAGGVAAFLGFTLPSFLIMVMVALYATRLPEAWLNGLVTGLKWLAVVVVADAVLNLGGKFCRDRFTRGVALATAVVLWLFPGVGVQLLALLVAALIGRHWLKPSAAPEDAGAGESRVAWLPFGLFAAVWLLLWLIGGGTLGGLARDFYSAGALVFGGGHVVLPLLEGFVGDAMSQDQFLTGYATAQAVPGPMFSLAAYLGAQLAPASPWLGAGVATLAIFLPGFLLVLALSDAWRALAARPAMAGAVAGINAAVVGLLLAALYQPVFLSAVAGPRDLALVVLGFLALRSGRVPLLALVVAMAALGLVIH
ncbi:MAG TPA: chorismate-binding protein [Alcanivorax sp.]|jgi:chromate transporter|uniref:Chromate transporter n=1 Tax=Alloalcanivorax venustensis ISO4 TaxID=1177184 RepID=A0ABS0AEF8_9GAMM|nr:chromate efflux transporter [Alloalcanivorax venustensis]MBF5052533.1 chromate transporter [Alloalcanivorax venustensis ISO4]MEC8880098.1 chromate efflux transporter [Pseudomonadota bacterium]MEE3010019.1 chromate efflux transporter [Pseudomonadota bacterium]HCO64740.1 chorismate-binding protein [Alcanivorax sp.]